MTTQKEKNVLEFKDKDILKNHKVADKDDEWFHEQWKNKLSRELVQKKSFRKCFLFHLIQSLDGLKMEETILQKRTQSKSQS
ncbi:hypothetical protein [Lactococcus lactis]|uniref:hypothetical protein n=1 Tax=Lactococcus lactis TaxID=1358 RepID=UPI003D0C818B